LGVKVLRHALEANPSTGNLYRLAKEMPNPISGLALAQESKKARPGRGRVLADGGGNLVRYAIFAYPSRPVEDVRSIHDFPPKRFRCLGPRLAPDALRYNLALANKGDGGRGNF